MERFISVDSGKGSTKIAIYNKEKNKTKKYKFNTKISEGNFADDALERNTFLAEYNGNVYKIGNSALKEAEMETSKHSEIHKISTLVAIAMACSDNGEVDEVHAVIGMPVSEWINVEKRIAYKNYILPDEEISIKIKSRSDEDPVERKFRIVSKHVLPESEGALFLEDLSDADTSTIGVIDIGHLNINGTRWNDFELDQNYCLTDELGCNSLVSGLSGELSSKFSRCDESYVKKVLSLPPEARMLHPNTPNPEIEQESKRIIDQFLLGHVKEIKRRCDSKRWSLDFMKLIFIGGTVTMLKAELRTVFGEQAIIPDRPEYANVLGNLRVMCGKLLGIVIPISDDETEVKGEKAK